MPRPNPTLQAVTTDTFTTREDVARAARNAAASARIEVLLQLRSCSHACVPPCPHTRRIDEMLRDMGIDPTVV